MYTTIIHPLRKSLMLSCNEYCVLDTIYHLSNNFDYGGWCIKSKQSIADDLDLSKQTVITIIDTLVKKELIIRNETTKHLRIGKLYVECMQNKSEWILGKKDNEKMVSGCFTDGKETLPHRSKNFTDDGKETLPNIYIYNSNNNISIVVSSVVQLLNSLTGKKYRADKGSSNYNFIKARLDDGYSEEELKKVIELKVKQWSKDDKMKIYLRPETLFNKTKFESYVNELPVNQESKPLTQEELNLKKIKEDWKKYEEEQARLRNNGNSI